MPTESYSTGTFLDFDENTQINVVKNDDSYTYICTKFQPDHHGVRLEYVDGGTTYRVLVPWHQIDRIYQEV
jgi:hypothetical protein